MAARGLTVGTSQALDSIKAWLSVPGSRAVCAFSLAGPEIAVGSVIRGGRVAIESDSHISAISPPGQDTVDVTVRTPVDVSAISAPAKFRYTDG